MQYKVAIKTVKTINLVALLLCIGFVLVSWPDKMLYFDEPFSITSSQGVSSYTLGDLEELNGGKFITASQLQDADRFINAYRGGDSLYYILLHWYSKFTGRTLYSYVFFSVLFGLAAIIALYFLARSFLGEKLTVSLTLVSFVTSVVIYNVIFSIRPYSMALFFSIVTGIFFYRYYYSSSKKLSDFFFFSLFAVLGFLSHYFVLYVVIVMGVALLLQQRMALFSARNLIALSFPVALLLVYFGTHFGLLSEYKTYQAGISSINGVGTAYSTADVISLLMKNIAVSFKVVFPFFRSNILVNLVSFLIVLLMFVLPGTRSWINAGNEKSRYALLFAIGLSNCLFLTTVYWISKNDMLFTFRYFIFSMPYSFMFMAFFIGILFRTRSLHIGVKVMLVMLIVLPGIYRFAVNNNRNFGMICNHITVADIIRKGDVHDVVVPRLIDAALINALTPLDANVTYRIDSSSDKLVAVTPTGNVEYPALLDSKLVVVY